MRRRSSIVWLLLCAMSLSGLAPAQDLVICLEPQGMTSAEVAPDACRCEGCPDEPGPAVAQADHSGCCDCIDILVPAGSEEPEVAPKPFDAGAPLAAALPCVAVTIEAAQPGVALSPRAPPRPALVHSRTIVLRI